MFSRDVWMDKRAVVEKLAEALNSFGEARVNIKFSDKEDVVEIQMVSDLFEDVPFMARVELVLQSIGEILRNEFADYQVVVLPITEKEDISRNTV
jgi:hypothetical protein